MSSNVARGHIGLSAIVPALHGLGHEVIGLPSILLSNHPGHRQFSKFDLPDTTLTEAVAVYERSGWLKSIAAVLTGYLPTEGHVEAAAAAIERVLKANPNAFIVCDPVCGDNPGGLYIAETAAAAMRDRLAPLAHCLTPNHFELQWLLGQSVATTADAARAIRQAKFPMTLVTSFPAGASSIANVLVTADCELTTIVPRLAAVPHGTGDYMAALFTGYLLDGHSPQQSLRLATDGVHAVAMRSQGSDELQIVNGAQSKPLAIDKVAPPS